MEQQTQQTQQQQPQTTGNFGESEYGSRLDYTAPVYRDWWAMVLFYAHVILVIVLTTIFWIDIDDKANGNVSTAIKALIDNFDALWVTIAVIAVLATIVALIWIQVMKKWPDVVIKFFLFLNIAAIFALIILTVIEGAYGGTVFLVLALLITCLVTYCAWPRIPFASVCLWIATRIAQTYEGTIFVAIFCSFCSVVWNVLWFFMVVGYMILALIDNTPVGTIMGVYFLMLISFYWGSQVCKAITHTTTCGVAATWVFSPGKLHKPTMAALKRTMTTSFGSVCLGSLITAVLSATRAFCRMCLRGPCGCFVYCILVCIESLIKWFNLYAFAQVAIYGTSFMESGQRTFQLLSRVGIWALCNDYVLSIAVSYASRLTGALCGVLAYIIIYDWMDDYGFAVFIAVLMAFFGLFCCITVLFVIQSCIICIFVCFSEDPSALQTNRPEEFAKLTDTNNYMRNLANGQYQANVQMAEQEYGGGRTQNQNNQTQQQPNQPR